MDGEKHKDTSPPAKRRKAEKEEKDKEGGKSNGHIGNNNDNLSNLKSSALEYIFQSSNVDNHTSVEYSKLLGRLNNTSKNKKVVHNEIIGEINKLMARRAFRRDQFLKSMFAKELPPLYFIYSLHKSGIIPLRDSIEQVPTSKIDSFVQLLKEIFYANESSDGLFDEFLLCLVTLQVESSMNANVSKVLDKLCDPNMSARKVESLVRLHYILKRVSIMRPERIPRSFFLLRLRHFIFHDGQQSLVSLLENYVKPILNPGPEESNKRKESNDEVHKNHLLIFSEFTSLLQKSEIAEVIASSVRTLHCDWELVVEFALFLVANVRDFGLLMGEPLHNVAKDAVLNLNESLLKVAFIFSWMLLPMPSYTEWFTTCFCGTTSITTSKQQKQFVASTMAGLVRVESSELAKSHRATLKKFPEMKTVMHDYLVVDRHSPSSSLSSTIGRSASVEDAITNARSFLESFKMQGKISDKLKTTKNFLPAWFKGTFIPALQSIEEEHKRSPLPEFKDIHLFIKALQADGLMNQNDINSWKASQDEQIAKVRAALRISKGKDVEKGKRPIDSLKSVVKEFIDRARVRNYQDTSSLFTEISSRVQDFIANHADQTKTCINLLLHVFCEVTKLLPNDDNSLQINGKNPSVRWSGHYVRRILLLSCIREPMMERVRQLVCELGPRLDDAQLVCLSVLLAHMTVAPEGANPISENSTYVTSIFQTVHNNIKNVAWMEFAAKLCAKFVLAISIVANYVVVPDSQGGLTGDMAGLESDEYAHEYGLIPAVVVKLLVWLTSRYVYGKQIISICSSHSTLHQHSPAFIDFSTTFSILNSISPPLNRLLERKKQKFSLDEFLNSEIRMAVCGDFLDSSWREEYIKTTVRETYMEDNMVTLQIVLEEFTKVIFGAKREDNMCVCGKTGSCSGKPVILAAYGSIVDYENAIEWCLTFFENVLDKAVDTGSSIEINSTLSTCFQTLALIHPSTFTIFASVKNLVFFLSKYLKFLVPFQIASLTHETTHSSSLVFVLLARVFGAHAKASNQVKDFLSRPPFGVFFALNSPIYKRITASSSDTKTASTLYSEVESIHSLVSLLQNQDQGSNFTSRVQVISTLPAVAAHTIFHSIFSLSNPLSLNNHDLPRLHDKFAKVEKFILPICTSLQGKHETLDSAVTDKTFEFLANFVDILIFVLSSSPTFNVRQIQPLSTFPNLSTKRESMDEIVEGLLVSLVSRLPLLLSVFSHPPRLSLLSTPRSTLFPVFSPSSTFSRYPGLFFLIFTSLSSTTLGKLEGEYWKEIALACYEHLKSAPHESFLGESFCEKVEAWMREWVERFGVENTLASSFFSSFDNSSPTFSQYLRQFNVNSSGKHDLARDLIDE